MTADRFATRPRPGLCRWRSFGSEPDAPAAISRGPKNGAVRYRNASPKAAKILHRRTAHAFGDGMLQPEQSLNEQTMRKDDDGALRIPSTQRVFEGADAGNEAGEGLAAGTVGPKRVAPRPVSISKGLAFRIGGTSTRANVKISELLDGQDSTGTPGYRSIKGVAVWMVLRKQETTMREGRAEIMSATKRAWLAPSSVRGISAGSSVLAPALAALSPCRTTRMRPASTSLVTCRYPATQKSTMTS